MHLILLTPLLVWPDLLFPHLTPKVLTFQILVEWVTACAVALTLLEGVDAQRERIARHPLVLALAVFLLYSLVSSALGTDIGRSLWGFIDRQDGLVLILHFFAWFVVLLWTHSWPGPVEESRRGTAKPRGRWDLRSYVNLSYWVGVLVALTALAQWFYSKFFGYLPPLLMTAMPGRVSGVLGNPMVLGPYLLFYFFYGFYYLSMTLRNPSTPSTAAAGKRKAAIPSPRRRFSDPRDLAIAISQALFLFIVALGQTRGVILGFGVAVLAAAPLVLITRTVPKTWKIGVPVAGLALLLSGGMVYSLRDNAAVRRVPLLYRLTHVFTAESLSTRMRLLVWQSAVRGFKDRPVLGWGHDNIFYALNKHYNPEHAMFNPRFDESKATWYDKAHNTYLDILVEKGLVGFALFVAVAFFIARSLVRMPDRLLAICLAAGLVQYAASDFVSFDSFGPWIGLFLTLSVLIAAELAWPGSERGAEAFPEARKKREAGSRPSNLKLVGAGILLVLFLVGTYFNLQVWTSSELCLRAQRMFKDDPFQGMDTYRRAFDRFMPYAARQKLNFAYLMVTNLDPQNGRGNVQFVQQALSLGREALAAHPRDVAIYMALNEMCNLAAIAVRKGELPDSNPRYVDQALEFGLKGLALSPNRQEVLFYLGRTYILRNEARRAVELNRQMVAATPGFPVAHWFLGLSLMADRQNEEARREIRTALQLGYTFHSPAQAEAIRGLFTEEEFRQLFKNKL